MPIILYGFSTLLIFGFCGTKVAEVLELELLTFIFAGIFAVGLFGVLITAWIWLGITLLKD